MSLSDRTQTKSHVLSMQILTCWCSLHLSTKAEVVLEWLFSLPLDEGQSPRGWYFNPQVKKKPSDSELTRTKNTSVGQISWWNNWIIYDNDEYCEVKRIISGKKINKQIIKGKWNYKVKEVNFLQFLKLSSCLCFVLECPYNSHFAKS